MHAFDNGVDSLTWYPKFKFKLHYEAENIFS